jgi:hypothetical protein
MMNSIQSKILKRRWYCQQDMSRSLCTLIPEPTWSIRDLPLHRQQQEHDHNGFTSTPVAVQDVELETLAKRCLIDLDHLSSNEREDLKVELGNIMKCISLVSRHQQQGTTTIDTSHRSSSSSTVNGGDAKATKSSEKNGNVDSTYSMTAAAATAATATEEEMYDLPRGFLDQNCPVTVRNEIAELQAWEMKGGVKEESEYVFEQYLAISKMVREKQSKNGGQDIIKDNDNNNDDDHTYENFFVMEEREPRKEKD